MASQTKLNIQMADLIFTLRQKCAAKDMYFVHEFGITIAEYNCLVLFFQRENYSVKYLAKEMDITPGGATRIITSLEKKGIIKRTISLEDRRIINVTLTRKGQNIVDELRNSSIAIHGKILNQIEPEFREQVVSALAHLIQGIDAWLDEHRKQNPK